MSLVRFRCTGEFEVDELELSDGGVSGSAGCTEAAFKSDGPPWSTRARLQSLRGVAIRWCSLSGSP